jgi:hypothetical protein
MLSSRFLFRFFTVEHAKWGTARWLKFWCNGVELHRTLLPGKMWKRFNSSFRLHLLGGKQVFKEGGLSTTKLLQVKAPLKMVLIKLQVKRWAGPSEGDGPLSGTLAKSGPSSWPHERRVGMCYK